MKTPIVERVQRIDAPFFGAIIASSLLLSCATGKPAQAPSFGPSGRVEYDALVELFKQQTTTPEVVGYTSRGVEQTSTNLMHAMMSCTAVGPDAVWPQMMIILKVNERGVVEEARADSSSPLAICVEKLWVGMSYDPPPFAPFYKLITLDAHSQRGV